MKQSETLTKIAPALVAALSEMRGALKDSKNPHFRNDYASLESVIEAAKPVLAAHGLAFMQGLGEYVGGAMTVSTRIIHESGEWIESDFQMPVGKADPQGTASASTYARRYSLMGILGLPALDDDGEAAMPRNAPKVASITSEQAETILVKLESTNSDKGRFLQYIGAPSISAIPANKYEAAINALAAKAK